MSAKVWLVFQIRGFVGDVADWDFQGAFASREEAIAALGDRKWSIVPATLGEMLPAERDDEPWPGCEWPNGAEVELVRRADEMAERAA